MSAQTEMDWEQFEKVQDPSASEPTSADKVDWEQFESAEESKEKSEPEEAFKEFLGQSKRGAAAAVSSIAGIPDRIITPISEGINWIAKQTQKYMGIGKPKTEEELNKFLQHLPKTREVYRKIANYTGIDPRESDKQLLGFTNTISDFVTLGVNPKTALTMATSGLMGREVSKDLGADPLTQEVVGFASEVGPSLKRGSFKKVREATALGEKAGLTPREQRFVTSAETPPGKIAEAISVPTKGSDALFKETQKKLSIAKDDIIKDAFPGTASGKGLAGINESVNKSYDLAKNSARKIGMIDPAPIQRQINKISKELTETVKPPPEKQQAIDYLFDVQARLESGALPAIDAVNWYQDLNQIIPFGRKGFPSKKKLTVLKDSIKQSLRQRGSSGKRTADLFEKANKLNVQKHNYQDVKNVLDKSFGEEGINFKKLFTELDKPETANLFKKSLGDKNYRFFKDISKAGKNIENLDQRINTIFGKFYKVAKYRAALASLANLALGGPFGKSAITALVGLEVAGRFSTRLMTDTHLQNTYKRFIQGVSQNKKGMALNAGRRLIEELERMRDEEEK